MGIHCIGAVSRASPLRTALVKRVDKQHILDEIRRTVEANGGVALGKQRFFSETGIRESDWSGKFWIRWGDEVREAGYEPNVRQTAFEDGWHLRSLQI